MAGMIQDIPWEAQGASIWEGLLASHEAFQGLKRTFRIAQFIIVQIWLFRGKSWSAASWLKKLFQAMVSEAIFWGSQSSTSLSYLKSLTLPLHLTLPQKSQEFVFLCLRSSLENLEKIKDIQYTQPKPNQNPTTLRPQVALGIFSSALTSSTPRRRQWFLVSFVFFLFERKR